MKGPLVAYNWTVVKLGRPTAQLRKVLIDTLHFRNNPPIAFKLEYCNQPNVRCLLAVCLSRNASECTIQHQQHYRDINAFLRVWRKARRRDKCLPYHRSVVVVVPVQLTQK